MVAPLLGIHIIYVTHYPRAIALRGLMLLYVVLPCYYVHQLGCSPRSVPVLTTRSAFIACGAAPCGVLLCTCSGTFSFVGENPTTITLQLCSLMLPGGKQWVKFFHSYNLGRACSSFICTPCQPSTSFGTRGVRKIPSIATWRLLPPSHYMRGDVPFSVFKRRLLGDVLDTSPRFSGV